jgi:hypothetical protein
MLRSPTSRATGLPTLDARTDFQRARRAQAARRAARWLARRRREPGHPPTLPPAALLPGGRPILEVVPLASIVGTVEPALHFDAGFRPASELVRARWERIALAHRRGISLPPITIVEGPGGFYVVDGRHRVSVALALGLRDINAWVTRAARRARHERRPCCQ